MELAFENKTAPAFREAAHCVKTVQETGETVVPDTNDDIGKIVSVRTEILLKSKENTASGVRVEGEAEAAILYITERADAVSFVKLGKKFTLDFDVPDMTEEDRTNISLRLSDAQARIVNPRKLALTFSVTGELSVYTRDELLCRTLLPEDIAEKGIHVKREEREYTAVTAAVERTFAVSEQFAFPDTRAAPEKLISERAEFRIGDTQVIGTKAIARGELKIEVLYLPEGGVCPMKEEFSTPFSQIIETGGEQTELCVSNVEICSRYFELTDASNGEKMLRAELHALLETVCCARGKCSYIADAYSNLCPCTCVRRSVKQREELRLGRTKLMSDEKLTVSEDCADILGILPTVSGSLDAEGRLNGEAVFDIVYRSVQGELNAVRKTVSLQGECEGKELRILSCALSDVYLRTDGAVIDARAALEVQYRSEESAERSAVVGLVLDEDAPYDFAAFPTVTVIRAEGEELWEYARRYHSSVEEIEAVNGKEGNYAGRLLLIPKSI